MSMNRLHEEHWSSFMADDHNRSLYSSWWTPLGRPTQAMQDGAIKANYVQRIFFKNTVTPELFDLLAEQHPDWRFVRTDTNPYLNGRTT